MENLKRREKIVLVACMCLVLALLSSPDAVAARRVYVAQVEGNIDAGAQAYVERTLFVAQQNSADLVVIELDTRGGLVKPMKAVVGSIIESPRRVCIYAYRKFSGVFSSGVYVLMASGIAAADPQASIGSARPESSDNATVFYYAEYLGRIAEKTGRDPKVARSLVIYNSYMDGKAALKKGVVEYDTDNLQDLLNRLDLGDASVLLVNKSAYEALLSVFSNPQLIALFFLTGCLSCVYILRTMRFRFVVVPLVAFAVCLWGLSNIEFSYLGVGLILLGVCLISVESLHTRPTIFGFMGAVAVVVGLLTAGSEPFYSQVLEVSALMVFLALVLVVFSIYVANCIGRIEMEEAKADTQALIGRKARVVEELRPNGYIKLDGRLWPAYSFCGGRIPMGAVVEVVKVEGKIINVVPEGWKPAHGHGGHGGHDSHGGHEHSGHDDHGSHGGSGDHGGGHHDSHDTHGAGGEKHSGGGHATTEKHGHAGHKQGVSEGHGSLSADKHDHMSHAPSDHDDSLHHFTAGPNKNNMEHDHHGPPGPDEAHEAGSSHEHRKKEEHHH